MHLLTAAAFADGDESGVKFAPGQGWVGSIRFDRGAGAAVSCVIDGFLVAVRLVRD